MAAAATSVVVAVAAMGCGGHGQRAALVWIQAPQVFAPRDLPRDRIVIGRIRNQSHRTLRLAAAALRVRDSRGHVLRSSAGFTASYAHGLFGAFQQPSAEPLRELVRLGRIVILDPGATSPVFAAWQLSSGSHAPVSLDYGHGRLAIPATTRPTAP
ncbi:MAG: hypothetical protein ACR2GZ_08495 [Solirubrobacteraceae bacterium]